MALGFAMRGAILAVAWSIATAVAIASAVTVVTGTLAHGLGADIFPLVLIRGCLMWAIIAVTRTISHRTLASRHMYIDMHTPTGGWLDSTKPYMVLHLRNKLDSRNDRKISARSTSRHAALFSPRAVTSPHIRRDTRTVGNDLAGSLPTDETPVARCGLSGMLNEYRVVGRGYCHARASAYSPPPTFS
jgi:hypothetical protein